jgi:cytidylate kinase
MQNKQPAFAIAIDGPVGSGKGTIAKLLAAKLSGFHLNTGAMYRCIGLYCLINAIDLNSEESVASILSRIQIKLEQDKVLLNGDDVTQEIKREEVGMAASKVGMYRKVREDLVRRQQEIVRKIIKKGKVVIAEGRDTGTRIIPDAALKIFLTADPETRARRKMMQAQARYHRVRDFASVLHEVMARDAQDMERSTDPLVSNPELHNYFVLDNSQLNEEQTVEAIMQELRKRKLIL